MSGVADCGGTAIIGIKAANTGDFYNHLLLLLNLHHYFPKLNVTSRLDYRQGTMGPRPRRPLKATCSL